MLTHLDSSLVAQIHEAQFEYLRGRMEVMRVVRGDPRATHYVEAEHVRACVAPGIPNPFFNQVFISGPAEWRDIERVFAIFEEFGMTPRFEIAPGAISSELATWLAERGFTHTQSDPILVQSSADVPQPHSPHEVQIDRIQAADANDDFENTYVRAWQVEAWLAPTLCSYISLWRSVPGWTLYLAREGTAPVGVGVLFDNGKVAYLADAATIPEYRRRGVQGALIRQRIADARQSSARFAFSRAEFGTASQRNLERAGLQSRYMVSIWTKQREP
jgi:GNAT superfamily N-acetyltransferase